jgi:hypothetical protein
MPPGDLVPAHLSDRDLLAEVARLAACEREASAALVALLAEMDARRLHLAEGCSSLFAYCTERLHLSEHAAYHRIEAARAVRAFPAILEHLRSGSLTLTAVTLLRHHLTEANHVELLEAARGCSKREVEVFVRRFAPLPDVRASVRKLPEARGAHAAALVPALAATSSHAAPVAAAARAERCGAASPVVGPPSPGVGPCALAFDASPAEGARAICDQASQGADRPADAVRPVHRPAEIRALSPARYSLRVTLSADGHAKFRRAQDLLRHAVPDGDAGAVVDRALTLLVEHLERRKFAATMRESGARAQRVARGRTGRTPTPTTSTPAATTPAASRAAEPDEAVAPRDSDAAPVAPAPPSPTVGQACGRDGRSSRYIPASVKREVWRRDAGRCAFSGGGDRCRETGRLEFHHRVPVADGGVSTVANLELRCTGHHQYETEHWFRYSHCPPTASLPNRPGPS